MEAAEAKPSGSSETPKDHASNNYVAALEAAVRDKDAIIKSQAATIKEQTAEIKWLNDAPARQHCLLEARDRRIDELVGINNSLLDEIERMKHAH